MSVSSTPSCPIFCVCRKCQQRTASEHRSGDERLGRDWRGGDGCGCPACRDLMSVLDEIDSAFAKLADAEKRLDLIRAVIKELP